MSDEQLSDVIRYVRHIVAPDDKVRPDRELLAAFATRYDQVAFTTLVKRHGPMVMGICRRVLHHVQDAEDAFQATFLLLAQQSMSIRKQESLASWLHGVAYRMAHNAKRSASRRRKYERKVELPQSVDPSAELQWGEVQSIVDEEIQRLPETYRTPFILFYLENRKQAEVARQLGIKEGTVWSRLAHSRRVLQERLPRRGVALPAVLVLLAVSAESATAAVPGSLVSSVVRAAALSATGGAIADVASDEVIVLLQGAHRAMTFSKCKIATLILLAGTVLGGGISLALHRNSAVQATEVGHQEVRRTEPAGQQPPDEGNRAEPAEETAWGEAVEGIQAGVTASKHVFRSGETATFTVKVRNVSEATITASYVSGVPGLTKPGMTSAANAQPRVLMPPERRVYHPTISQSLKPGEVFELGTARLHVQAAAGTGGVEVPTLVATPGKYQVAYSGLAFAGTAGPDKVWVGTGNVEIEVHDATKPAEKAESVSWGEASDGLQAGLAYPHGAKHAYHIGKQATFVVWLRNVSGRKATVSFWSPPEDDAGPIVVGKDRKPQQAYPEVKSKDGKPAKVIPPPVWHYSPQVIERILQPGEVIELGRPTLRLVGENPSRKVADAALAAAPGTYRVNYPGLAGGMEFATGTGLLTTGIVDLEVEAGEVKAAEESDPRPSDLSGNWQAVSFEQDGREKFSKEEVRKVTARFHDCRYHLTPLPWGPEGSFDGGYQIDGDTEEPKSFSLYPAKGVLKGQPFRGIYHVEGDTLTLCFSWPPLDRPTEFRSRPNSTIVLATFRRAKP